jgi:hypothetical protein
MTLPSSTSTVYLPDILGYFRRNKRMFPFRLEFFIFNEQFQAFKAKKSATQVLISSSVRTS